MIPISVQRTGRLPAMLLLISSIALGGCSKEELKSITSTVQEKAKEAIADVKEMPVVSEVLPPEGSANVQLATPIVTPTAFVRFYRIGEGRPSVIQWTSYEPEGGPETYPALLVRATTTATTLDQTIGQTLPSEIYIQGSKDSDVLCLPLGSFIDLTVARPQADSDLVLATVVAGELVDPAGTRHAISGLTVEGVLP